MEIQVPQILFQMLNFGLLLFVLVKFLFRPILDILDARSNRIAEGLAAAEKNLKDQEKLEAKKAEAMAKANAQAKALIAQARDESKKMGEAIVAEAKAEAQKVVAKQEADFAERMRTLESDMQKKMADLVVATTKSALSDALSAADLKSISAKMTKSLK